MSSHDSDEEEIYEAPRLVSTGLNFGFGLVRLPAQWEEEWKRTEALKPREFVPAEEKTNRIERDYDETDEEWNERKRLHKIEVEYYRQRRKEKERREIDAPAVVEQYRRENPTEYIVPQRPKGWPIIRDVIPRTGKRERTSDEMEHEWTVLRDRYKLSNL
jgi:hypothetical protein